MVVKQRAFFIIISLFFALIFPLVNYADDTKSVTNKDNTEHFDDWTLQCISTDFDNKRCELTQILFEKKTMKPVVKFQISMPLNLKYLMLTVTVPLGIDLQSGVQVSIDNSESISMQLRSCFQGGCVAILKIDEVLLSRLKKGNMLSIIFKPIHLANPLRLSSPLKGISKAIAAADF